MNIRKIAAVGGLAIGAALTFAPLASADPAAADPVTPLFDSEVSSLNSQFELDALFAGDSADVTKSTTAGVFDTINQKDTPYYPPTDTTATPTSLEYEIYGVNPVAAGISHSAVGTGPYNLFNGAEAKFDDAINAGYYGLLNNNALDTNPSDYFGYPAGLPTAVLSDNATQAFDYFYNSAIGDLSGFFQTNLSFLDIPTAAAAAL